MVHEAYLRLVGNNAFADGRHFFRVAAEAMRQILIDRARRKQRGGRGRSATGPLVGCRSGRGNAR